MSISLKDRFKSIVGFLKTGGALQEASRIESCAKDVVIFFDTTSQKPVFVPKACNSRFCPVCGPRKRARLRARLQTIFDAYSSNHLRFITLTQQARKGEPLEVAWSRLQKSFEKFRRCQGWRENVLGYFVKWEVSYNASGKWWHVHLHILAAGHFWHRDDFLRSWHRATGERSLADIRFCDKSAKIELSKYITKAKYIQDFPWEEFCDVLSNHREFALGGDFQALKPIEPSNTLPSSFIYFGSIWDFYKTVLEYGLDRQTRAIAYAIIDRRSLFPEGSAIIVTKLEELIENELAAAF